VVRWTGPPSSEPAPQLVLTAADAVETQNGTEAHSARNTPEQADARSVASTEDDDAPTWPTVAALALGALGLLIGAIALHIARSARAVVRAGGATQD
jgi:hypothetical protein